MYYGFVTVAELKQSASYRRLYLILLLFAIALLLVSSMAFLLKGGLLAVLLMDGYRNIRRALPQPALKSFSLEQEQLEINGCSLPLADIKIIMKNSLYHWLAIRDAHGKKHRLFFFNDQLTSGQLDQLFAYLRQYNN